MLKRYSLDEHGRRIVAADIYTRDEHTIDNALIDPDAVRIIERLKRNGCEAYLVGGAVRDLLIGKKPKDFDIATSAYPKQIRKLFWNSRIIGRRFKLAHIYFQEKIFEVSTFRSADQGELGEHNVYGTIEEDAARRDFTVNSFYYDPLESRLLDFRNAMRDLREHRIRSIIPLSVTFIEDPVRMIRCIKYSVTTGFKLPFRLRQALRRQRQELKRCSSSRMTEEVLKILQSGYSEGIFDRLMKFHLLDIMLPEIAERIGSAGRGRQSAAAAALRTSLQELDAEIASGTGLSEQAAEPRSVDDEGPSAGFMRSRMLVGLVDPFIVFPEEYENSHELFKDVFRQIKQVIQPLTPPNYEVEKTAALLFRRERIKVPRNAVRKPKTSVPMHQSRNRSQPGRKRGLPAAKGRSGRSRGPGSSGRKAVQDDKKTEENIDGMPQNLSVTSGSDS